MSSFKIGDRVLLKDSPSWGPCEITEVYEQEEAPRYAARRIIPEGRDDTAFVNLHAEDFLRERDPRFGCPLN